MKALPESLVPWAVYATIRFLKNGTASFDHRTLQERITLESGQEATEKTAKKAKDGLLKLFEWILANNPANEGKYTIDNILGTHSNLSAELIDLISNTYTQVSGVITSKPVLKGTQLVDVDWTAGFSIEPHEAYVKVKFNAADPETGQEFFRVVRLTLAQFKVSDRQALLKELRKLKSVVKAL